MNAGVTPIIELRDVSKSFPGVKALDHVSFSLKPGECRALVGENGAGKSTLAKIIIGHYTPSEGALYVDGANVSEKGGYHVRSSQQMGIAVVHQELQLIPEMNGLENLFIGNYEKKFGLVSRKAMLRKGEELLSFLGAEVDLTVPVKELRMAEKQIIQLAKAVSMQAKMIIMDELTAVLQEKEIENIYRIIRILKQRGIGIIYISHRLDEIFEVCDTYTVLCDGRLIHSGEVGDVNKDELIAMIIGREMTQIFPPLNERIGDPILELKGLTSEKAFRNIDMTVRTGEVVGIAGLVGAGKTELLNAIFGNYKITDGEIIWKGEKVSFKSPSAAIRKGIGLVPDERKQLGLVMNFNVVHNITLPSLKRFEKVTMQHGREREEANGVAKRMRVKATPQQSVVKLSGGNQQKIVISKWVLADSELFLFDEPTRGIDVGAKAEIYKLIHDLTAKGKSVVIVSPELEELLGLCHSIYVMFEGEFQTCVSGEDKTQSNIISKLLGV
ncbi:sugar ABC transporter ATP-binding protein [Paenibacillus sp. J5C_2022]|uniref:sugar ABC transporter ATP-binding protein n=1 Tax=Paenibacillus sp. J5C2022 TaxID=2977129 RepID=UPI0021CF8722|nr:sugar ABC transporter ATP-binding protein [Paenibacillus sp. J5C2022]MCU6709626.1 sugar ABC transporter ATP-binding protein [Paenibacillus sp. J5C2022]